MTIIKHQTRTEYVVEYLKSQILNGKFKGGEALRQNAIAKELGVSHIPVREALLRLSEQGLVRLEPHRGAVVHELSSQEIDELSDLRVLIECNLVRKSFPLLTQQELDQAEELLTRYEEAVTERKDMEIWGDLNFRFHCVLYRAEHHPLTMRLLRDLHRQSDRYIRYLLLVAGWGGSTHDEHRQLLKLAREGLVDEAVELTKEHICNASRAISGHLRVIE